MKKTNYLQKMEDVIIVITFIVMTLSAFLQVCNRNITKIPVTGFEELSKYCMIYMVLLGTEMGLRDGTQIAVTALQDKLKGRARLIILILIKAVLILFAAVMFYQSIALCEIQLRSGQTSPGLGVPMVVPYFALLLSFGIITIVQTVGVIQMLIAFVKGNTAKYEFVDLSMDNAEKLVKEEEEKLKSDMKGGGKA
ncbi:TRAP transporter small permease [[Clostridium] symbiosum]|uniref:TRAP transporter small permease n=1 Tax=Clostridium symbiosum TaxID=1512 RepID=UPI001D05DBA0|nr:TRAP transporter small permease [[Clostridium] symbiosum]MCB6609609.1 TRAP transporter small permease [[Clostridium] symbiosum]MCB6933149.1 TRAP transporter small permease [[Clostridium] symbiosum]